MPRYPFTWQRLWPVVLWMLLLALLPWWLGMPALLGLAATLLLLQHRLSELHAWAIRRGLRWGLSGGLIALQRGLGGSATAWAVTLSAALAGYTLLVALEGWLDRRSRPAPSPPPPAAEWPELAMAPVGPSPSIVELLPPHWQYATDGFVDPRDAAALYRDGDYYFSGGMRIGAASAKLTFSPDGRWFVAALAEGDGVVLWDRELQLGHRLPGWTLCGWYQQQPWLIDREEQIPWPLSQVLERMER